MSTVENRFMKTESKLTFFNIDEWPVNVKLHYLNWINSNWTELFLHRGFTHSDHRPKFLLSLTCQQAGQLFSRFHSTVLFLNFVTIIFIILWILYIKQFINMINKTRNANILHSSQDRSCTANHDICLHRHIHRTIISLM